MIRLCQVALLVFVLSRAYGQSSASNSTIVQIAAWTTTGERIEKIWAVLTPGAGGKEYKGSGKLVEISAQTGEYILQVSAPGFRMRRQVLRAYQPSVFRSVALPIAPPHGSLESSLTGTVRNYDGDIRSVRVRLMGLYGDELYESVPDEQGSFKFPVDEGVYLLVIVADVEKGLAIIDTQPVVIPYGKEQTVTVDLKEKHGTLFPLAEK